MLRQLCSTSVSQAQHLQVFWVKSLLTKEGMGRALVACLEEALPSSCEVSQAPAPPAIPRGGHVSPGR